MKISEVDFWACHGTSPLHKASPSVKLIGLGLIITAVIMTNSPFVAFGIYGALLLAAAGTGLPLRRLILLGSYPVLFALVYAWASFRGSWYGPGLILGKTLSLSMAAVLNIATTPYPEVLRRLTRFLPPVLRDVVFLTYRSVFILLGLAEDLGRILRLRGGLTPGRILTNLRNLAGVFGILLIKAIDQSQHVHSVMRVRGYAGLLVDPKPGAIDWRRDVGPPFFGALALGIAVLTRIDPGSPAILPVWLSFILLALLPVISLGSRYFWPKLSR
jgi:energy-coupling factor transporter transmembrane protein EcfT